MDVIEQVEDFIQKLHDLDLIIAPHASQLLFVASILPSVNLSLADNLANSIIQYEQNRGSEKYRASSASACLVWINKAYTFAVIKEGEGLMRKLRECQERNTQLQTDNETLSEELLNLKRSQEELYKHYIPSGETEGEDASKP